MIGSIIRIVPRPVKESQIAGRERMHFMLSERYIAMLTTAFTWAFLSKKKWWRLRFTWKYSSMLLHEHSSESQIPIA